MANVTLLQPEQYQIFAVTYLVIFTFSLLLNCSVIFTFMWDKTLLIPSNFLLVSMAISDLLNTTLATSVGAYANYHRWWTMDPRLCEFSAFVSTCCGLVSIWHHVALAAQRWITFKFTLSSELNRRNMVIVIVLCWAIPLVYSTFPLFGWSSFGPEPGFVGCSVTWYSTKPRDLSYIMIMFALFFFAPLVVIVTCYVSIHRVIKSMTRKAVLMWGFHSPHVRETFIAKTKNFKMSFIMSLAFIIAWTPYAAVSLFKVFGGRVGFPLLVVLPAFFAKLSSCHNPIIYFFKYLKFRNTFIEMIFHLLSHLIMNFVRNIRKMNIKARRSNKVTVQHTENDINN